MFCWPLLVHAVSFPHRIYFSVSISPAADIFFLLIGYDKPISAFLESLVPFCWCKFLPAETWHQVASEM